MIKKLICSGIANTNDFPEYDARAKFSHTPQDLIEKFKIKPLNFEPETREYNEGISNYNLLAFIIEKFSVNRFGVTAAKITRLISYRNFERVKYIYA